MPGGCDTRAAETRGGSSPLPDLPIPGRPMVHELGGTPWDTEPTNTGHTNTGHTNTNDTGYSKGSAGGDAA